jgi:peptidoglycan/LPS O-acetylase OafA/YrhL
MSLGMENQTVVLPHKRRGIASFIIGATCIIVILLLAGIVMSGTELPGPMLTALEVLPGAMLCAALIGIGLGIFGATDRSSRKLYPLLGLISNVIVLMVFLALALLGMLLNA